MTDHLTYSLLVPGPVKGCTRPQGQARDKYYSLAMLSIVLLRTSKAAVAITPCSIMTIDLSLKFGAVA